MMIYYAFKPALMFIALKSVAAPSTIAVVTSIKPRTTPTSPMKVTDLYEIMSLFFSVYKVNTKHHN